jgi:hypothetical protein
MPKAMALSPGHSVTGGVPTSIAATMRAQRLGRRSTPPHRREHRSLHARPRWQTQDRQITQ